MGLTVMTLNLWNDAGPWEARRDLVRNTLARLRPDLVGFQEVLVGEELDQAVALTEGLGYEVAFAAAARAWRPERRVDFGNAVASRLPIRAREVLPLPQAGGDETRVALSVTVEAPPPVGEISFTCTHLDWKLHHGWVRERQVVALCEHVRAQRPRGGFPPILVGDFNAEPESAEIRYVQGLHSLAGRSMRFRDAWKERGTGSDGITWSHRNPYADPWLEPDRRIDYVFVGPPAESGLGRIERCRLVCDRPRRGVWPSDHFGVWAELRDRPVPRP